MRRSRCGAGKSKSSASQAISSQRCRKDVPADQPTLAGQRTSDSNKRSIAMSRSTRISRRTVLRGLGTAIALPALEAMLPRTVACRVVGIGDCRQAADPLALGLHAQRPAHARLGSRQGRRRLRIAAHASPCSRNFAKTFWSCPAWRKTTHSLMATAAATTPALSPRFSPAATFAKPAARISRSACRPTKWPRRNSAISPDSLRSKSAASMAVRPAIATRAIAAPIRATSLGKAKPRRSPRK